MLLIRVHWCPFVVKEIMPDENEQPKERKSLDDRAKMTELERIRHSTAHVLSVLQNPTITAGANTRRRTRATPAAV